MDGPRITVLQGERLTPAACRALSAVSGVSISTLIDARILPASRNLLRAPWYRYARGGAITIRRSIYFTRRYFDPDGWGNDGPTSTWRWLQLLAHEVGHLPQGERFGLDAWGTVRYLAVFTWQYGSRAVLFRTPVHDGARLEIEADLGRQVLMELVGHAPIAHPLVHAVHQQDEDAVRQWCAVERPRIEDLQRRYRARHHLL